MIKPSKTCPYEVLKLHTQSLDAAGEFATNQLFSFLKEYNHPYINTIITAIALRALETGEPVIYTSNDDTIAYFRPEAAKMGGKGLTTKHNTVLLALGDPVDEVEKTLLHELTHLTFRITNDKATASPYHHSSKKKFADAVDKVPSRLSRTGVSDESASFVQRRIIDRLNHPALTHYNKKEKKHNEWSADLAKTILHTTQQPEQSKPMWKIMRPIAHYFGKHNLPRIEKFITTHPSYDKLDLTGLKMLSTQDKGRATSRDVFGR